MRNSQYTALFRKYAEQHKLIRHGTANPAFFRIISSGPPYDGLYIEELRQALKTLKLAHGYCLVLETYTNDYHDSMSQNIQKEYNGCFYIIGRIATKGDFDAQEEVLDTTEEIAENVLSYWKEDMEVTATRDRIHKFNGTGLEKVGPIEEKYFGTKCYLQFTKSANLQLEYDSSKWI